jgi:hypothetical protein
MKCPYFLTFLLVLVVFTSIAPAQNRNVSKKPVKKPVAAQKQETSINSAIVVDERLAILRAEPSLYARSIQRMRLGRVVRISGSKQADGVMFYRVFAMPNNYGWVQAEAIVSKLRRGDDERLARLLQASDGFEQIETAMLFLEIFSNSPLRPAILLLLGDLMEEIALKLSQEATRRLDRREMAASGAPLHSFYLNYVSLDRYRRLGLNFVFNSSTQLLHYDGASWREITAKFPTSSEATEAQKRLEALKIKMEGKSR